SAAAGGLIFTEAELLRRARRARCQRDSFISIQSLLALDCSNLMVGLTASLISHGVGEGSDRRGAHVPARTLERSSDCRAMICSWRDHSRVNSKSAARACTALADSSARLRQPACEQDNAPLRVPLPIKHRSSHCASFMYSAARLTISGAVA